MKFLNTLFFKIAGVLILVFLILTGFYVYHSYHISEDYHDEITQGLNKDVASHIVKEVQGLYDGKVINEEQMSLLMHHVMATNPATEVYLLDLQGNILKHVAMNKVVKATKINLVPVKKFIEAEGEIFIKGDDPRNIGGKKIFSAAPVYHNNSIVGFIYTIVGGQDYDALKNENQSSYIRKLSTSTMIVAILTSLLVSLLVIWYFTKNLTKIRNAALSFAQGDLTARIEKVDEGEFSDLASTFNSMATTIEKNILELKNVDNLRKELIANISHDLRTPIASIQGFIETLELQDEQLSQKEKQRYMSIVVKNTKQLKKMVDDLFELSKLETKQRNFHPESVQMAELIQDVADKYRVIAQTKGININTIYAKNIPLVKADISLIDRALQNIIDNSIKFCEKGDLIQLEVYQEDQQIVIKIQDSGAGIEEKEIPHIFDRYRKGKFVKETHSGSGLGLAIVKKIMDLHETKIQVISKLNEGTTFLFSLPIARQSA